MLCPGAVLFSCVNLVVVYFMNTKRVVNTIVKTNLTVHHITKSTDGMLTTKNVQFCRIMQLCQSSNSWKDFILIYQISVVSCNSCLFVFQIYQKSWIYSQWWTWKDPIWGHVDEFDKEWTQVNPETHTHQYPVSASDQCRDLQGQMYLQLPQSTPHHRKYLLICSLWMIWLHFNWW